MPANLEIRFIEDGSGSAGGFSPTSPAAPGPTATPRPGSTSDASNGPAASLGKAAAELARALGVGGLYDATRKIVTAFTDAAAKLRAEASKGPKPTPAGPTAPAPAGNPASSFIGPQMPTPGASSFIGPTLPQPGSPSFIGPMPPTPGPTPAVPTPSPASPSAGLGPMAQFALVGAAAAGVVFGLRMFGDALRSTTEELAGLSGPVAASVAQNETRMLAAQQRRAEQIGPDLAAAYDVMSSLEVSWYDFKTQCLKGLLKIGRGIGLLGEMKDSDFVDPYLQGLRDLRDLLEQNNGRPLPGGRGAGFEGEDDSTTFGGDW